MVSFVSRSSVPRTKDLPTARASKTRLILKRAFDASLAAILLLVMAPFMLLVAIAIKIDSRGPVFYAQWRTGLNRRRAGLGTGTERRRTSAFGRPFRIYKFRSMRTDAEPGGKPVWCRKDDPRVTRMGNIMRKTHMDELPQLFNILIGDMSFVGPRPERPEVISDLTGKVSGYEHRLLCPPGLTGLAQISHPADLALGDVKKKLRYDRLYLKRASMWMDMVLILGTVPKVLNVPRRRVRKISRFPRRAWDGVVDQAQAGLRVPMALLNPDRN